jgi:hypothetical protein
LGKGKVDGSILSAGGAREADANVIANAVAKGPWPSYEERMAVFTVTGPWMPSQELI